MYRPAPSLEKDDSTLDKEVSMKEIYEPSTKVINAYQYPLYHFHRRAEYTPQNQPAGMSELAAEIFDDDDGDYKGKGNNIISAEQQLMPGFEDLDRKWKRSTTYVSWNSGKTNAAAVEANRAPTFNSRAVNAGPANNAAAAVDANRAPTFLSRAVNGVPFGPYTTWLPYRGPLTYASPRQRRHDSEGNAGDDVNGDRDDTPPLFQYAPTYNTYALFPAHHVRFIRNMPLQYPYVSDATAYPPFDELAPLTNSLGNTAHTEDREKF